MAVFGFEGFVHEFGLAGDDGGVLSAVEEPDGRAAETAGVFGGEGAGFTPAVGRVAPEDAGGGDGDGGPAVGVVLGQLPGAVAAEREADEVGAVGVGVELACLLIEAGHGHLEHVGVGPEMAEGALRHDDDEGPALGVVAQLLREGRSGSATCLRCRARRVHGGRG